MKVYVSKTKKDVSKGLANAYLEFLLACGGNCAGGQNASFREQFEDQLHSVYYKHRDNHGRDRYAWTAEEVCPVHNWYFRLREEDRKKAVSGLRWSVADCGGCAPGNVPPSSPEDYVHYLLVKYNNCRKMEGSEDNLTFLVSVFADSYGLRPIKASKEKQ